MTTNNTNDNEVFDHNELAHDAIRLAEQLLRNAKAQQSTDEHDQYQKIARMMDDQRGKALTIALVDQAFRSHRPARIADQLSHLLDRYGTPAYMDWWERAGLALGGIMAHYLPGVVVPPIVARLRQETSNVILPGEEGDLRDYLQKRRAGGVRLNLNQLGEAILGEEEAQRRLDAYLALVARPDVEYISVKISSIFSQINLIAFAQTVAQIKERLRILYRHAQGHQYAHPDGSITPKFINLDMEEYRDLHLTVAAFCGVLDEDEFLSLRAGIVLQAYLPDSSDVQRELTTWSRTRVARGGAPIKIRIVKGANLAMEKVEAALHDWPQAPYTTKRDVDANYKRMVAFGCQPENAHAVHLGIASHNLFDIAYALLLRDRDSVHKQVEFEMLEGMANHQARAVQARADGLLLYAPVVKVADFHSAIAYLVRRLDENTSPENFLHDLFGLEPGSASWQKQRDLFLDAVRRQDTVRAQPNRTQNRQTEQLEPGHGQPFANVPDTDFSLPANQAWVSDIVASWQDRQLDPIPLQIDGETIHTDIQGEGIDPSRPGQAAYHYAQSTLELVDRALAAAVRAQPAWGRRTLDERCALLEECATELARRRGDLIGCMMVDSAKTVGEADPEISEAIDFARYYAHAFDTETLGAGTSGADISDCNMEPLGVVVVTPPWNFPLAIPAGGVLSALMAGNTVILKPAPETTLVGWHLAQALWEAGIPRDVLQFVPAPDNEVGQALVTDERVGAVILTGSTETAQLFQGWQPTMRLFAETSGKNSLIVTSMADQDQAIKDLVKSAFGHNGQKCSAASLAILEAEIYDNETFRRQLRDAAASLIVGSAWDLSHMITPRTQPPSPELARAQTTLEPGEAWLLEPQMIGDNPHLWSPGIKLGVRPRSFFHQTECFGPVLGLMRAENLDEALSYANGVDFGLTSGLHSLDDREIARWKADIQAGNLYINRHITGAIVRRQPFGGWNKSVVGPGAKAGGPNYVLQLGNWQQATLPTQRATPSPQVIALLDQCVNVLLPEHEATATTESAMDAVITAEEIVRASAQSYAWAWQTHFSQEHDPSQVLGEVNIFRYRPCRDLLLRVSDDADPVAVTQVLLAVRTTGQPITVSMSHSHADAWSWLRESESTQLFLEDEETLLDRLGAVSGHDRMRVAGMLGEDLRRAANRVNMAAIDAPPLANGRLELRYYLREQAVSQTVHRYGNLLG